MWLCSLSLLLTNHLQRRPPATGETLGDLSYYPIFQVAARDDEGTEVALVYNLVKKHHGVEIDLTCLNLHLFSPFRVHKDVREQCIRFFTSIVGKNLRVGSTLSMIIENHTKVLETGRSPFASRMRRALSWDWTSRRDPFRIARHRRHLRHLRRNAELP